MRWVLCAQRLERRRGHRTPLPQHVEELWGQSLSSALLASARARNVDNVSREMPITVSRTDAGRRNLVASGCSRLTAINKLASNELSENLRALPSIGCGNDSTFVARFSRPRRQAPLPNA